MSKIYKLLSIVAASLLFATQGNAQAINEGFENGITTLTTTSGWAINNLSTPIGTNPTWTLSAGLAPRTGTAAAIANFNNVAGAGTISNWLIAPTRTLNNGDVVSFWTRDAADVYADRLQVRISTNGASTNVGTTNTSVGDFTSTVIDINPGLTTTGYPTVYTQYTFTISGLAGPTSGRIAFRYFVTSGGPTGTNSDAIAIDDFVYTPVGAPTAPDVTVGKGGEYTLIPLEQITSMNLSALITNAGNATATDAQLKVNVYQASNLTTPILAVTSPTAAIAAAGSANFTAGTFTPTLGSYVIKYISSCTSNSVTSADTSTYAFSVVNNFYARDNGTPAQGVGAGNTISVIIGNNFTITKATTMDSVLFFCNPTAAGLGDTVRVRIANTTAGVPNNASYIGESLPYKFTAANSNTATVAPITLAVKNLSAGPLTLAPGTYFVGIEKYVTTDNYGLQCTNDIFTANTVYANISNGAYSPLNTLIAGFNYVPIIRPYLNTCSSFSSSISSSTNVICNGGSTGAITVNAIGGTSPYTSLWSNGSTVTAVSNLVAGVYTNTVTDANGCVSVKTATITEPTAITLSITPTNVLCNGANTGALNAVAAGGTPGYTYLCSNGTTTTAQSNLVAGTYNYTVTDANGCSVAQSASITEPTAVSLAVSGNTSTCLGGTINLSANGTGGTGAITYTWMPGSISTNTYTATPTTNSTYTLTASDANGCLGTPVITNVTVNSLPTISAVTNNTLLCVGQTATLSVSGSAATYTWSTTENTTSVAVSPTVQTTYTVSGTDANGCSNTITVTQNVSACTGIASLINDASINVYPNPNKGVFVVELTSASKVNVMNALGQVLISEAFEAGKHTVNINNLSTGVYFVKVMTNNKQQIIKVIKE